MDEKKERRRKGEKEKQEKPVTVNITNHNQFQKGVGAFITNLNHLTIVMDGEGNMKLDASQVPTMPHTQVDTQATEENEADGEEEKRKRLAATNTIIRTENLSGQKIIDLLALFHYIDLHFVGEINYKYEWYALKRFLAKYNLLRECDSEQFAQQMNQKEWFAHSRKSCEANEMNNYNYLNGKAPDIWADIEIPAGNNATKRAAGNLSKTFANLELYKEKIIGR